MSSSQPNKRRRIQSQDNDVSQADQDYESDSSHIPAIHTSPTRPSPQCPRELPFTPSKLSPLATLPPPFQKPTCLLTFSYTPAPRQLRWDDSSMRYFVDPPPAAQLGYGYEKWVRKPDEKGRLDTLLWAWSRARGIDCEEAPGHSHDSTTGLEPDHLHPAVDTKSKTDHGFGVAKGMQVGVVTWRGVMTKILTAPYDEGKDITCMNVMYINGTLYFEEHLNEGQLNKKNNMEPRHRLLSYYGYAFESYCTSETPTRMAKPRENAHASPQGWGGDVDTNAQWCSIVKTKLGDTRIVIGGEVDCVRNRFSGKTDSFVELKTSMIIRGTYDEINFEKKLLKFYFQSFLLGVPEIVVGFRTPNGLLQTIQSLQTVKIPSMIRGKPHAWDPTKCLEWANNFLHFMKDLASQSTSEPSTVWRVKFIPKIGVSVYELTDSEKENEVEGGDDEVIERVGFLPKRYFDMEVNLKPDGGEQSSNASGADGSGVAPVLPATAAVKKPVGTKIAGWQI